MKHVKQFTTNERVDHSESGPSNNVRQVLPTMVRLTNNSRLTQELADVIAVKLNSSEFNDFQRWLQMIESEIRMKTKNKFYNYYETYKKDE